MALTIGLHRTAHSEAGTRAHLAAPVALAAILALLIPLMLAGPSNLTSDESLYLAEAYNIAHGHGATYPSGEAITHRAPLYPALLAPAIRVGGLDSAYAVTKTIIALNVVLVLLIAWRMGGAVAGSVAGVAAAGSAYLRGLGTTLYLDPAQCTAMLLALLFVQQAMKHPGWRSWIAAGAVSGIAFLVKESAMQWAPLGALVWLVLPAQRRRSGAIGALAYTVSFGLVAGSWPAYVWLKTSEAFLIGDSPALAVAVTVAGAVAVAVFAVTVHAWPRLPRSARSSAASFAMPLAVAIIFAWWAFVLYGLTAHSQWGYPNDYATNLPEYLTRVAPAAQPFLLIVLAWAWCMARACSGDERHRLIAISAILFGPFAVFIANRGLQLRDALPLVYLSYVVLGMAVADALHAAEQRAESASWR
ncbi:MAG TPA: glycosyltransferase family 39 protein, partial [Dehalococcoidia bacterium]